ncbi:MAG: bifunctional phosphoribosylaminoimidazolecarboxamide formyltransferase/IMP cyclohydrolase [Gemmatimonadota bacterium]
MSNRLKNGRGRRALLSVSNKEGILEFGRGLVERGFQLVSTGGTARALQAGGIPVTGVSEVTGHPEILDGRVKTLHPAIHGPLLARRDDPTHVKALDELGYHLLDVVAVNLYPFRETVAAGDVTVDQAMEKVDIGGPTMIRAAAKNHAHVWVVVDPSDYPRILAMLDESGSDPALRETEENDLRRAMAVKVFRHIAEYDTAVAEFLAGAGAGSTSDSVMVGETPEELPASLTLALRRKESLRYGENPDQLAALYTPAHGPSAGVAALQQLHGKALSYNNLLDLDGALLCLSPFARSPRPAVVIVKHTTPCGVAVGRDLAQAYGKALACDPTSAFGSVIAVNRMVDPATAEALSQLFVECVVAPGFQPEALEILTVKKNIRVLVIPSGQQGGDGGVGAFLEGYGGGSQGQMMRSVYGGALVQSPAQPPLFGVDDPAWKVVSQREPTDQERADLAFAWAAVFGVKSNAIVLARDGATVGIGAGQMSRVDSSRLAVQKAADAGLTLQGSTLASDAFFPFRDGVDAAAQAGVQAIIQPGGSVRDDEVVAAADEHGMAMVFTGRRLFRH